MSGSGDPDPDRDSCRPTRYRGGRRSGYCLAFLLALLAGYGTMSTPGLIGRWGASAPGFAMLAVWLAAAALAVPLAGRRPSLAMLGLLAAVALAMRIAVAACFAGRVPGGDALYYLTLAGNILGGRGFEVYEPYIGSTLHALYPPAYALLLSGWIACAGASTASLVTLNILIDGAAAAMICRIGVTIGRPGGARAAAWLYLLWPAVLLSAPLAQKESFCTLLVLILAHEWLIVATRQGIPLRSVAIIGAAAGLLALTQPGQAPLAALFGLVLAPLLPIRRIAAIGLAAMPVAALILVPWWVRNWLVLGAFVPLTSTAPIGLWIGNNPGTTGNWMPPPPALRGLPELEYGRAIGAIARQWIVTHPAEFVRLTLTKFLRAVGVGQAGVSRLSGMTPHPSPALLALLFPTAQLTQVLLLGGSAVGVFRLSSAVRVLLLLLVACLLQLVLFGVWFEFSERHRDFMTPFLLLIICCADWRRRRPRAIG